MNDQSKNNAADKYRIFEDWLRLNGAEFSLLELRSHDDDNTKTIMCSSELEADKDGSEEKKETKESTSNIETRHDSNAISDDSEMRGVHAKIDIPIDTICVAIPKKCLITVEMGQATEIGQLILKSDLDLDAPKHIFLMIYLLWDRKVNGGNSFFKPYYDILPKTLSNIPIFWNDEELEYLKGSYLLTQIKDRIEAITEDYYSICEVAPQLKSIATLDEFKWARMCVCSRNFGLQINGHRTSALVPHADMLNHRRPRETKWSYDDELQAFTITTLQPIVAGSQVYDSYGQKCNHRFLLNYGFAIEDNSEPDGFCPNEVPIALSLREDDPLHDLRYEFWMRGEQERSSFTGGLCRSDPTLSAILSMVAGSGNVNRPNTNIGDNHQATETIHNVITAGSTHHDDSTPPLVRRVRVCISNNENTRTLFSLLRVLVANQEELRSMATSPTLPFGDSGCSVYLSRALRGSNAANQNSQDGSTTFMTMQRAAFLRTCKDIRNPINLSNEKAAMALLLEVVSGALSCYPTTLSQDSIDLMNQVAYPKFSNRRHAKIQVKGEKEVLHHFAFWAQTAMDVIGVLQNEIENEQNKKDDVSTRFDEIIQEMEDDDNVHFTVLRYCRDVLGALRKDAVETARQKKAKMKLDEIDTEIR